MLRTQDYLLGASVLLLLTGCVAAGSSLSPTFATGRDFKESAPGKSVEEQIVKLAEQGFARWKAAPSSRKRALADFEKVVELADAGRARAETEKARWDRYRKMIRPTGTSEADRTADLHQRLRAMLEAIATARFHIAEASYLRCQGVQMPPFERGKRFSPTERQWWTNKMGAEKAREWQRMLGHMPPAEKRLQIDSARYQYWIHNSFQDWRSRRDDARHQAEKLYLRVVDEGAPTWEAAAAARVGDLYKTFAVDLENAPIDPSIEGDPELLDIYRGALEDAARPYRDSAKRAYRRCVELAKLHSISNATSRSCAAELAALEP